MSKEACTIWVKCEALKGYPHFRRARAVGREKFLGRRTQKANSYGSVWAKAKLGRMSFHKGLEMAQNHRLKDEFFFLRLIFPHTQIRNYKLTDTIMELLKEK